MHWPARTELADFECAPKLANLRPLWTAAAQRNPEQVEHDELLEEKRQQQWNNELDGGGKNESGRNYDEAFSHAAGRPDWTSSSGDSDQQEQKENEEAKDEQWWAREREGGRNWRRKMMSLDKEYYFVDEPIELTCAHELQSDELDLELTKVEWWQVFGTGSSSSLATGKGTRDGAKSVPEVEAAHKEPLSVGELGLETRSESSRRSKRQGAEGGQRQRQGGEGRRRAKRREQTSRISDKEENSELFKRVLLWRSNGNNNNNNNNSGRAGAKLSAGQDRSLNSNAASSAPSWEYWASRVGDSLWRGEHKFAVIDYVTRANWTGGSAGAKVVRVVHLIVGLDAAPLDSERRRASTLSESPRDKVAELQFVCVLRNAAGQLELRQPVVLVPSRKGQGELQQDAQGAREQAERAARTRHFLHNKWAHSRRAHSAHNHNNSNEGHRLGQTGGQLERAKSLIGRELAEGNSSSGGALFVALAVEPAELAIQAPLANELARLAELEASLADELQTPPASGLGAATGPPPATVSGPNASSLARSVARPTSLRQAAGQRSNSLVAAGSELAAGQSSAALDQSLAADQSLAEADRVEELRPAASSVQLVAASGQLSKSRKQATESGERPVASSLWLRKLADSAGQLVARFTSNHLDSVRAPNEIELVLAESSPTAAANSPEAAYRQGGANLALVDLWSIVASADLPLEAKLRTVYHGFVVARLSSLVRNGQAMLIVATLCGLLVGCLISSALLLRFKRSAAHSAAEMGQPSGGPTGRRGRPGRRVGDSSALSAKARKKLEALGAADEQADDEQSDTCTGGAPEEAGQAAKGSSGGAHDEDSPRETVESCVAGPSGSSGASGTSRCSTAAADSVYQAASQRTLIGSRGAATLGRDLRGSRLQTGNNSNTLASLNRLNRLQCMQGQYINPTDSFNQAKFMDSSASSSTFSQRSTALPADNYAKPNICASFSMLGDHEQSGPHDEQPLYLIAPTLRYLQEFSASPTFADLSPAQSTQDELCLFPEPLLGHQRVSFEMPSSSSPSYSVVLDHQAQRRQQHGDNNNPIQPNLNVNNTGRLLRNELHPTPPQQTLLPIGAQCSSSITSPGVTSNSSASVNTISANPKTLIAQNKKRWPIQQYESATVSPSPHQQSNHLGPLHTMPARSRSNMVNLDESLRLLETSVNHCVRKGCTAPARRPSVNLQQATMYHEPGNGA